MNRLFLLCALALGPLVACVAAPTPRTAECAPCASVTIASASATASAAPPPSLCVVAPLVPFRDDQMKTRIVASWPFGDGTLKGAGEVIATSSENGSTVRLPRPPVLAKLAEFAVDLTPALDRIEELSQKVIGARNSEMEVELASREKKAKPGSIVGERGRSVRTLVQLSTNPRVMTFSIWWSVETRIQGPLITAPQANCSLGQPCAQMADYRLDASVSVTAGVRYVLTREGALVEEIVFAPHGNG